jgi:hypothetical protein
MREFVFDLYALNRNDDLRDAEEHNNQVFFLT